MHELPWHACFDALPVALFIWRHMRDDFVLVAYNDAANDMTHGWIDALLGTTASQLYAGQPDICDALARCFSDQTSVRLELRYQVHSGDTPTSLVMAATFVPPDLVMVRVED